MDYDDHYDVQEQFDKVNVTVWVDRVDLEHTHMIGGNHVTLHLVSRDNVSLVFMGPAHVRRFIAEATAAVELMEQQIVRAREASR